jgi:bifunctional non-homologous end joining protein LigD
MLAYKHGDRVHLVSRNGVDHTRRFRDLATAISKLSARSLVLDGEAAIYDAQLRSRFDWLREPDPEEVATPPLYMAFDLLYREGRDLSTKPLRERRRRLEDIVDGSSLIFPARRLSSNGLEAWAQVLDRGFEGYVAKDEASPYVGGVTRSWLKVKVPPRGWTDPEDRWKRVQLGSPLTACNPGLTQEQLAE